MIPAGAPGIPRSALLPVLLAAVWTAGGCATTGSGDPLAGGPSGSVSPRPGASRVGRPPERGTGFRGVYRGSVHYGGRKRSFRQVLALEPPDRARVEVLGPMGNPRLILAFDGRGAMGVYPKEKVYFREESQESAFTVLLGVPLTARDLVPLMTGEILFREPGTRVSPPRSADGGWVMTAYQPASDLHYVMHLSRGARRVRRVELYRGQAAQPPAMLTVDYPEKSRKKSGPIPDAWDLRVPGNEFRLSVRLVDITRPGEGFPDETFHPSIPPDFRRVAAREIAPDRPLLADP